MAMFGFEGLAAPLSKSVFVSQLLVKINENMIFSIIMGTIITAIIQSSTAMIGIAMGFVHGGLLSLPSAVGIMLGSNIGTVRMPTLPALAVEKKQS